MNLILFITFGSLFSSLLGEFGRFPFGTPGAVSINDVFVFMTAFFLLIWKVGIEKKLLIDDSFKWLILFWLVGMISLLINQNLNGILYLVRFIFYSTFFWVGFLLILEKKIKIEFLLIYCLMVGVIFLIAGFIQLLFSPDLEFFRIFGFDPHQGRLTATFLDPNFAGAFLTIFLLISLCLWKLVKSKLFLIPAVGFLIGIILTFSRSSWLMMTAAILFWSIFFEKKIVVILLIIFAVLFFASGRFQERILGALSFDATVSERIESWQRGLVVFEKNPLLGVGFNNLDQAYIKYNLLETQGNGKDHSARGVDSSLIFIMATTGIVGLLVYLGFIVTFFKELVKRTDAKVFLINYTILSMTLGIFIHSQFVNSLFYPSIMQFFYLILGAGIGYNMLIKRG